MDKIIWAQSRIFFNKNESHQETTEDYFKIRSKALTENKYKILKSNILPLRDYLKSHYSDKWHFLGIYEKERNLYMDIRFRMSSINYKDFKDKVNEFFASAIESGIICNDIDFDDEFLKNYRKRFKENDIVIILDSLELFCDKFIELISSDDESSRIQSLMNKEFRNILGELCHLVLFQAGVLDTPFHLLEALRWSGNGNLIDLLIRDLSRNPSFKMKFDAYTNGQHIPKIIDLIEENMCKY